MEVALLNTVHVSVAAAIVAVVPNPFVALPLALASHILLDTVPHWNWHPGGNLARVVLSLGEMTVALIFSIYFVTVSVHPWIMAGACFLSTLPDLIQGPYYFLGIRPAWLCRFISWERVRQKWPWMRVWMGVATQVVVLLIALLMWQYF